MREIIANPKERMELGHAGENGVTMVIFDIVKEWQAEIGANGTVQILVQRDYQEAYPAVVELQGDKAVWLVTAAETAHSGDGQVQLSYVVDGKVAKSCCYDYTILPSLEESVGTKPPHPLQNWCAHIEQMLRELPRNTTIGGWWPRLIPRLTSKQKAELKALMNAYRSASKTTFTYDDNFIRNHYANNQCWMPFGSSERIGMCCNTFVEMIWMGRAATDFVGKNRETYINKITPAFDWGYYFHFNDRKYAGGVAERNSSGKIIRYYNYQQPYAGNVSDPYKNSYSTTSVYDPEVNEERFPKKQKFNSFMTCSSMARELYQMGCQIPMEELDVGDLVFIKPRAELADERDAYLNHMAWRNIAHVAMVYEKDRNGILSFIDCTDRVAGNPILCNSVKYPLFSDVTEATEIMSNVVMCARHPAAWGKENMAEISRVDFMPMRYQDGNDCNNAIVLKADGSGSMMAADVKKDLYYVFNSQIGIARNTGAADAWDDRNFQILYK